MKTFKIKTVIYISILTLVLSFFPSVSFAQNVELSISVDSQEISKGEYFVVTVTFTGNQPIGDLTAEITYDEELMTYQSGGGNAVQLSNGKGGIWDIGSPYRNSLMYSFTFRANDSGEAKFEITHSEVIGHGTETLLGSPIGSKTITIASSEDNEPTEPVEEPEPQEELVEITRGGKTLIIPKNGPKTSLPPGFELTSLTLDNQVLTVARHAKTGLTLIYAVDENLKEGFYVYDPVLNTFYNYFYIDAEQRYTFLHPVEDIVGFSLTTLDIQGNEITVLKSDDNFNGKYLIYAMNQEGAAHYYFFDDAENTLQRAWLTTTNVEGEQNDNFSWIIFVLSGICVALLLVIFRIRTKTKSKNVRS
ncbi:hypothetical protein HYG86_18140 [Alkalicella caledoniensis]|uniref:Cohesin domain-containing protein n=1 Tax=Alkalicella caledoniensis TaxID=2731377 RepID=A0A7G9WCZ4_ALKCA|nr:hypothetical protein [Alkalicella caledoniensis]QNO16556.1 hypothetical protein HYG86_18140 [Alkalicella caledoniensis]